MIISNESMDFNDPQLFGDQLEVWTLIIQKSTVIPSSLMVLFLVERALFVAILDLFVAFSGIF